MRANAEEAKSRPNKSPTLNHNQQLDGKSPEDDQYYGMNLNKDQIIQNNDICYYKTYIVSLNTFLSVHAFS